MKVLIVLAAMCAATLATPVGPVILPKVQVAPAELTVVKQPYTITETEPVYRSVPVPIKAVSYTAPAVVPGPVIAPVAYAPPAPVAYAAVAPAAYYPPAPVAYAPAPAAAIAYTAPVVAAPAAHYI